MSATAARLELLVVDHAGHPARGAVVRFRVDGMTVGTVHVQDGSASLELPEPMDVVVEARFQGRTVRRVLPAGVPPPVLRMPRAGLPGMLRRAGEQLAGVALALVAGAIGGSSRGVGIRSFIGPSGSGPSGSGASGPSRVAVCPDGTGGSPCALCRVGSRIFRVCG